MITHPKISVVIPAYNEERYLPECLESLKNQTYPEVRYEVIVVDNNSTDKTRQIAEGFGMRVVGCKVQGVAAARAAGFKAAKGEIIASIDADSKAQKDWLEKIAASFSQDPALGGITGGVYLDGINKMVSDTASFLYDIYQRLNFSIGRPAFSGFNFAVRNDKYKQVGGFNPNLASAEDIDLSLRLKRITKLKYFSEIVVHTSGRRLKKNPLKFFGHNVKNYFLIMFGGKPEPFESVR